MRFRVLVSLITGTKLSPFCVIWLKKKIIYFLLECYMSSQIVIDIIKVYFGPTILSNVHSERHFKKTWFSYNSHPLNFAYLYYIILTFPFCVCCIIPYSQILSVACKHWDVLMFSFKVKLERFKTVQHHTHCSPILQDKIPYSKHNGSNYQEARRHKFHESQGVKMHSQTLSFFLVIFTSYQEW